MRILVAEDDSRLLTQLDALLQQNGYSVDLADNGDHALFLIKEYDYDLAIVDIGMPKLDGFEVIRKARQADISCPILILTARDRWQEKVEGLDAGADDYLTKPFHNEELLARTKALIRRASGQANPTIQFGPGRTRPFDPYARDVGRMVETDDLDDMYKFKTPALRNVSLTAPYGHNGAYPTLKGIIKHHLNPVAMNKNWKPKYANLPSAPWLEQIDFVTFSDKREQDRIISSIDIKPIVLSEKEIDQLVSFLQSLTGKSGNQRPLGKPEKVPSGLTID